MDNPDFQKELDAYYDAGFADGAIKMGRKGVDALTTLQRATTFDAETLSAAIGVLNRLSLPENTGKVKPEEAGYRRGVQAAIETAKQQRCRDEYPKTNREKISHERGCNGAIKRIRALLPPDTQDETDGSVQEARK